LTAGPSIVSGMRATLLASAAAAMPCCRGDRDHHAGVRQYRGEPAAIRRPIEENFCRPAIAVKAHGRRQPHAIDGYTVRLVRSPVRQPAAMEGVI
jgi:hypothetical protein